MGARTSYRHLKYFQQINSAVFRGICFPPIDEHRHDDDGAPWSSFSFPAFFPFLQCRRRKETGIHLDLGLMKNDTRRLQLVSLVMLSNNGGSMGSQLERLP